MPLSLSPFPYCFAHWLGCESRPPHKPVALRLETLPRKHGWTLECTQPQAQVLLAFNAAPESCLLTAMEITGAAALPRKIVHRLLLGLVKAKVLKVRLLRWVDVALFGACVDCQQGTTLNW